METNKNIEVKILSNLKEDNNYNLPQIIYDLDTQIQMLSNQTDALDYLVSISSGILCAMLDILWTEDFNLTSGRKVADEKIKNFVIKTSKLLGCKDDDLKSCITFLEKSNPIPSDGNTPDFGGGLQHHLRDFAHHPTIIGLIFSLLTQFTENAYGTDTNGNFIIVPVQEKSKLFIGQDIYDKLFKGTIIWFFHLISDMAGSKATVLTTGGTGIPGPILSLAKELSTLPVFKNIKPQNNSLSTFLSKLFNGTLFAKHDANGKIIKDTIIKLDLRGELGVLVETGKQVVPVIANDIIVRTFYFIRRFAMELQNKKIKSINDFSKIELNKINPFKNSTITRMLTIATGVFTTIDLSHAVISKKYWVCVNYVGIGRFAVAIGSETANFLKVRNIKKIKKMYQEIEANTYIKFDNNMYERIEKDMNAEKFGLTIQQTEILYNLEAYKVENDLKKAITPFLISKKIKWLKEWQKYMESGFSEFVQDKNAVLHWYTMEELYKKIKENEPTKPWFRLVLLECMLFEPYFALSTQQTIEGNQVPSNKYNSLKAPFIGYNKKNGDEFLDNVYKNICGHSGYVFRLRKCYKKVISQLNETLKNTLTAIAISVPVLVTAVITAGIFAPKIATKLVGSRFPSLKGVALANACLAFLGGGAVSSGGFGMTGGTAVIVGGGVILGLGIGSVAGGTFMLTSKAGKKFTIQQSAKLVVSMQEIFLKDEHDLEYSTTVYEEYATEIIQAENELTEIKLKSDVANDEEKKKFKSEIKNAEKCITAMRTARKIMQENNLSFKRA